MYTSSHTSRPWLRLRQHKPEPLFYIRQTTLWKGALRTWLEISIKAAQRVIFELSRFVKDYLLSLAYIFLQGLLPWWEAMTLLRPKKRTGFEYR